MSLTLEMPRLRPRARLPVLAGAGLGADEPEARRASGDAGHVPVLANELLDVVVGSGIEFADRGAHELKGVPGEWRLLAVGRELEPDVAGAEDERIVKPGDRTTLRVARRAPGALRLVSRMSGARARRRAAAHP